MRVEDFVEWNQMVVSSQSHVGAGDRIRGSGNVATQARRFDAVGDGNCVVNPKPAPDLFVWVAGRLGVYPQQAIVFEDAKDGIEAARAGGFWTVGLGGTSEGYAHIHYPAMSESLRLDDMLTRVPAAR